MPGLTWTTILLFTLPVSLEGQALITTSSFSLTEMESGERFAQIGLES